MRIQWEKQYKINPDESVHPLLFSLLTEYLDQDVSLQASAGKEFLMFVKEVEQNEQGRIFKSSRPRKLLVEGQCNIGDLLKILVEDQALFEQYLFCQQFSHPGWSGMVSAIEHQPDKLPDGKNITLHDLICLELLLEIDALDHKFGEAWEPLGVGAGYLADPLLQTGPLTEPEEVLLLWQEAFEWSCFDNVVKSILQPPTQKSDPKRFQVMFCMNDKEYSLKNCIEQIRPDIETFDTPGYFGVEFYFKPEQSKYYTRACPSRTTPGYLIREEPGRHNLRHLYNSDQSPLSRLILRLLLVWSAVKRLSGIFRPALHSATSHSAPHIDKQSYLTIEYEGEEVGGLQVGFAVEEMARRVGSILRSIGLIRGFASVIYVIGHNINAVNARVFSHMANLKTVRDRLRKDGLDIPDEVVFIGALYDAVHDEIEFYDEVSLSPGQKSSHDLNQVIFGRALSRNARIYSGKVSVAITRKVPNIYEGGKEISWSGHPMSKRKIAKA
ncbi:putative inorganic carbon transporter subunit DabA [Fulvivirga ulvae]|uniref:putative inorganic carbon transporter subunit DabA n=1 Tax=Fulvivirga ulvae TaxID=2904245 RepID=UPI002107EA3E|nr:putative inorganic carbon transporter subunit DabA [Fulvivirga ulvae]